MAMWNIRLTLLAGLAAVGTPAAASGPFSCQAHGDTWTVVGTSPTKQSCRFVCVLQTQGRVDGESGSCTATVGPNMKTNTICETMVIDKKWTGATLTTSQCAYAE